jgi:hypothetical protein
MLFLSLFKLILLCWNCRNLNASYLSGQSPSSARPHSILTQIPVWVTAYGLVHILHNLIDLSNTSLLRWHGKNINPVSFHNVPSVSLRLMWVWNKGMWGRTLREYDPFLQKRVRIWFRDPDNYSSVFGKYESRFHFVVVTLCDSCEVRSESRFYSVVVTLHDSCEVRTESRFHSVVVKSYGSCEVRTESRFHFVVVTLRDSWEVRTGSRFHFVV